MRFVHLRGAKHHVYAVFATQRQARRAAWAFKLLRLTPVCFNGGVFNAYKVW